jgi:hypothetical protein
MVPLPPCAGVSSVTGSLLGGTARHRRPPCFFFALPWAEPAEAFGFVAAPAERFFDVLPGWAHAGFFLRFFGRDRRLKRAMPR